PLAGRCRLSGLTRARVVGDRLRAGTSISQGPFIGLSSSVGFCLGLLCFCKIIGDAFLAVRNNRTDTWQCDLPDDRVEKDEGDDAPEQLRSKRLGTEGRECALMLARYFGMGSPRHRGTMPRLEREQQQQRNQQREDAERFGHGEPEDQVAELALRG